MSGAYAGDRTTGFASPASDSTEGPIDLSAALDLQRPNRYPVRVVGDVLAARGILHGDILIVDIAGRPRPTVRSWLVGRIRASSVSSLGSAATGGCALPFLPSIVLEPESESGLIDFRQNSTDIGDHQPRVG